jgi:hypothetical protein
MTATSEDRGRYLVEELVELAHDPRLLHEVVVLFIGDDHVKALARDAVEEPVPCR